MEKALVPVRAARSGMEEPVRCCRCGHAVARKGLDAPEYRAISLKGVRHLASGDCEPDEWVTICPDCGARESFEPAVRCAECLEFPCICEPAAAQ